MVTSQVLPGQLERGCTWNGLSGGKRGISMRTQLARRETHQSPSVDGEQPRLLNYPLQFVSFDPAVKEKPLVSLVGAARHPSELYPASFSVVAG